MEYCFVEMGNTLIVMRATQEEIAKLGKDQAQKEEAANTGTELEEMALQKDQVQKSIDII